MVESDCRNRRHCRTLQCSRAEPTKPTHCSFSVQAEGTTLAALEKLNPDVEDPDLIQPGGFVFSQLVSSVYVHLPRGASVMRGRPRLIQLGEFVVCCGHRLGVLGDSAALWGGLPSWSSLAGCVRGTITAQTATNTPGVGT